MYSTAPVDKEHSSTDTVKFERIPVLFYQGD